MIFRVRVLFCRFFCSFFSILARAMSHDIRKLKPWSSEIPRELFFSMRSLLWTELQLQTDFFFLQLQLIALEILRQNLEKHPNYSERLFSTQVVGTTESLLGTWWQISNVSLYMYKNGETTTQKRTEYFRSTGYEKNTVFIAAPYR